MNGGLSTELASQMGLRITVSTAASLSPFEHRWISTAGPHPGESSPIVPDIATYPCLKRRRSGSKRAKALCC